MRIISPEVRSFWSFLQESVFTQTLNESDNLFNPYNQILHGVDLKGGDRIRKQNLRNYLACFQIKPIHMIIGEAPGWRGCRLTGVPFTSEALLTNNQLPFHGLPSGQSNRVYTESSATIFWRVMRPFHPHFLVWNCLPYHPHLPAKPLSNRQPSKTEIRKHLQLLDSILKIIKPEGVIAVGRRAEFALTELGVPVVYIRHPSHGGADAFRDGIEAAMLSARR